MPKVAHCKICDQEGHYAYQCFKKKQKPLVKTRVLMRAGKHQRKWRQARKVWFRENTKNVYRCYLCGKLVDRPNITLDHIKPRGSHPELRYEQSNLAPVHFICNGIKGSRKAEEFDIIEKLSKEGS